MISNAWELSAVIISFGIFLYLVLKGMSDHSNYYDMRVAQANAKKKAKK